MKPEFIPAIILLSLLVIQYFVTKRRAATAVKAVAKEEEFQNTSTAPTKSVTTIKGEIERFMKNEEKFWLLGFVVVAVITILLYTVPVLKEGHERWKTVGWITIACVHVFIFWNFYRAIRYDEKLHPATKFFVGGCVLFWSIAPFVPNFAEWTVVESKEVVKTFDSGYNSEAIEKSKVTEQSAIVSAIPPKRISLTSEWSEAVYPPPSGGRMTFYCTEKGSEMKIDYDSAESALISPNEKFYCPLQGEKVTIAKMLVNARYYFKSDGGGSAIVENGI